jgi:hypothetical protein
MCKARTAADDIMKADGQDLRSEPLEERRNNAKLRMFRPKRGRLEDITNMTEVGLFERCIPLAHCAG